MILESTSHVHNALTIIYLQLKVLTMICSRARTFVKFLPILKGMVLTRKNTLQISKFTLALYLKPLIKVLGQG